MEQMTVTLDRLIIDKANVRKNRSNDDLADLLASIPVHGIIQPLAVRPPQESDMDLGGQLYRVVGGGRRLLAIEKLIAERKIPADFSIPVIVRDLSDTVAAEVSLIENVHRKSMGPVDEFRAFKELVEAGQTVEDIALHFGVTERLVEGRLALARLHPDVLAALEADDINLATAAAYTVCPDPERQAQLLNSGGWQATRAENVRHFFMNEHTKSSSRLADFIGEERYRAAGGEVRRDLFTDEAWWVSGDVIADLRNKAIDELKATYQAEGWSWVMTNSEAGFEYWNCQRLYPEAPPLSKADQKKLEKLEAEMRELVGVGVGVGGFDEECFNDEDDEGFENEACDDDAYDEETAEAEDEDPRIREIQEAIAAIRAKQTKVFTKEQKDQAGVLIDFGNFSVTLGVLKPGQKPKVDSAPTGADGEAEDDTPKLGPTSLSMLGKVASAALCHAISDDQENALRLLLAALTCGGHQGRPVRLRHEMTSELRESFDTEGSFADAFKQLADFSRDELIAELAIYTAHLTDISDEWMMTQALNADRRQDLRKDLCTAFKANPLFFFDAEAFFASCKKPYIIAAYKEMTGDVLPDGKKAALVEVVVRKAQETNWLPPELRLNAAE